jgi:hypothetical protein
VTGTAPIASSGGATPAISISQASGSVNGFLSSTDWTTFNNKGSGTVTSVSISSANGFSGSSSGGATPALTLTTSITGVLKGNGTAISAATAGTDYVTPTGSETLTNKTLTNPTLTNYTESVVAIGTVGDSHTLVLTNGTVQTATLTAATPCTFTMPTATSGKSFVLQITQASSVPTTATFTGVKFPTGVAPIITITASAVDIISFVCIGGTWYGTIAQAFA